MTPDTLAFLLWLAVWLPIAALGWSLWCVWKWVRAKGRPPELKALPPMKRADLLVHGQSVTDGARR